MLVLTSEVGILPKGWNSDLAGTGTRSGGLGQWPGARQQQL